MPSKTRKASSTQQAKAARAKTQKPRAKAQKGRAQASAKPMSSTQNDIFGVILGVLAAAMLISLLVPSSAVVTSWIGRILALLFGSGAILIPIALFVFAMTFFMDEDGPISGRVAFGLALIVLANLAILSLNLSGAADNPDLVITPGIVENSGGYVGGAVAWALLKLVGVPVGNVVLVGLIVIGVIVCGFSISGAIASIRKRLDVAAESVQMRLDQRREARSLMAYDEEEDDYYEDDYEDDYEERPSYLGARKTSVLKRGQKSRVMEQPAADTAGESIASRAAAFEAEIAALEMGEEPQEQKPAKSRKKRATKAEAEPKPVARPGEEDETYELPPISMLAVNPNNQLSTASVVELDTTMRRLQLTLEQFGLTSRVVDYVSGPLVTTFRVEMGEGERVNKIVNLSDDIALTLAAESVRIMPHIPGTSLVGIEIPNSHRDKVSLGDVITYAQGGPLEVAIGRDADGSPVVADIETMPHMLVAGSTGSGKSVMINSMIMSLLMRTTPKQVRLILVDPKRVEFSCYNGLPHLYVPVVTEPRQAASALAWAVSEMERRLKIFERASARDIKVYNTMCTSGKLAEMDNPPEPLPYILVVIDELADLMMVAGKDVESSIVRLAQLARAAGIHLVIATQRPSSDVVTGLIKSNIDNRIALKVSSSIDSRVILDETGAEKLLGNGDMLFKYRGHRTRRILGCYTADSEIEEVVDFIRAQAEPDYHEEILTAIVPSALVGGAGGASTGEVDDDPLIWEAAQIVVDSQLGSTSGLQRQLSVGYARAGRIMDMLEAKGVVGPPNGSKPRDVLLDKEGLEELRAAETLYREVE